MRGLWASRAFLTPSGFAVAQVGVKRKSAAPRSSLHGQISEIVAGNFLDCDILVEVTALALCTSVSAWLLVESGDQALSHVSPITETHWKSSIFTVEPEPGFRFSFWAWSIR